MKILIRVAMFIVIGAMFFSIMGRMQPGYEKNYTILYSDFIQDIRNGAVAEVTITGETVKGKRTNGERFVTYNPDDGHMIDDLIEYGVKIKVATPEKQSMLMHQRLQRCFFSVNKVTVLYSIKVRIQ